MLKKTKRKAFNFLRSYFDVFNELESEKDKLDFLTAIINKQFLDEDPKNLSFIVNLCYESQRHQIETSVKGWLRATKDTLGTTLPTTIGTTIGTTLPTNMQEEEEEEKEEVKENINNIESIDFDQLLKYINDSFGRNFKLVNAKVKNKYKSLFKQGYKKDQVREAIDNVKNNQYHKETNYQYCTVEFFSRPETLDKYSNIKIDNEDLTISKEQRMLNKYKGIELSNVPYDDRLPLKVYREMFNHE